MKKGKGMLPAVTPTAVTEHGTDHAHESRVDGNSEETATHVAMATPWVRPSNLDAPPPRKGMVQRWIRRSVGGAVDTKNLSRAWREGWRPVPPDDLPPEWQIFKQYANKEEGVVVVDDMQLMMIPQSVIDAKRKAIEKATALQMASVEFDLDRAQVAGHPILRDHKTSVTMPGRKVGRSVEPADDE